MIENQTDSEEWRRVRDEGLKPLEVLAQPRPPAPPPPKLIEGAA